MRIMAGHPAQMGCFEIRRASVVPPDELLSMIWPELDAWKDRFGLEPGQINDLAVAGLTNLLLYLREVILQDSVTLRKRFPKSLVWNHAVFQHKAYEQFAERMKAVVGDDEERPSQHAILLQAMPALADCLSSMDANIKGIQADMHEFKATMSSVVVEEVQVERTRMLQLLTSEASQFRIEPAQSPSKPRLPLPPPPLPLSMHSGAATAGAEVVGAASSCYASARASLAHSLAPDGRSPSPSAAPPLLEPQEPPRYTMCR